MKKIYSTLFFLLLTVWLSANPVSKDLAKKVAVNFLGAKKSESADTFLIKNVYTHYLNGVESFYVFAFPNGGFVIVSADDEANPIIGYSSSSPVTSNIDNPAMQKRFEWYAKQVEQAAKLKAAKSDVRKEWKTILEGKTTKGEKTVGPLLQTTWNQSPYYNDLCPTGTPTGCVATAMSQIMNYHEWPLSGNGSNKYTHATYGEQFANFEAETYNWANMPAALSSSSTSTQKTAVATLCYHAGVSVNMDYAPDGSGASSQDVLYALTSYFKYDPTTINIYDFDVNQQTSWISMVKDELDAERPVYYSGSSSADGGHAWVCDGYDNSDRLHINWGWGGYYDGYFTASAMNPGTYSFSESNSMITGIKPGTSNQTMLWIKQASGFLSASRGIRNIAAVNNSTAWAVAYDGSGDGSKVRDFTRTTDGGKNWVSGTINATGTDGLESSMITAVNDNTAWVALYDAAGGGKIVKTSDGGNTWTVQSSATFSAPNGFPNVIYFWDENNGFCMGDPNDGYFEIYTTTNGGDTWYRVPQANIPANLTGEFGTIGFYAVYGDIVWFATTKGRIFKSTDKGYTWVKYQTPLSAENFETSFKDANNGIIQSVGTTVKSYRTTDGGENWTQITPTGNFYQGSFSYIPNTNILISSGSDYKTPFEGISYSLDNGNTFTDYADLYKNFQFLAIGASPEGAVWAGGFNTDQYNDGMWYLNGNAIFSRFSINKTSVARGDSTVILTDKSYGNPDSWEWNFGDGASPETLTGQGPHTVKYTTDGDKTITLTITKGDEQYVYICTNAINVTWPDDVSTDVQNSSYIIYPNPATVNNTYVRINGFEKGTISVFDIKGALVWQSQGVTEDDRVNIGNFASGLYIVRIQKTDGSTLSRKLTISR